MRIGAFQFKPGLVPSLAMLVLLPLMLSLGLWQLDRAEQKREWMASVERAFNAPPLDLNQARPDYPQGLHRQARAYGRFDAQRQFLLDNQIRDGRLGYMVLIPLRLAGSDSALLVERGWLAAEAGPQRLPAPAPPPVAELQVQGRLDRGPAVAFRLGPPAEPSAQWPQRLHYIDFDYLQSQLPYPLLPYLLRSDAAAAAPPVVNMTPAKHIGYAVQWFAMAAALALIYLALNIKRRQGA